MKKWKKLVALALAAILAMSLLTACGGGGGSQSFETQVENAVFDVYSRAFGVKTNDAEAKELAQKSLGYVKNGRFYYKDVINCQKQDGNKVAFAMPIPRDADDNSNYCIVMEITPKMLAELKSADISDADIGEMKDMLEEFEAAGFKVTGLGVAAKTIDGKTYAAFGIKMEIDTNKLPM